MSAKETTPLTAAGGKWSSGLCSCFSDCTSCLTVCCLKPVALGQLSQKVLGYPCLFVTILLFSLCMLEDIFGAFDTPSHMAEFGIQVDNGYAYMFRVLQPFALAFAAISSFAFCVVVATVRNTIRRRDKIEQGTVKDCGGCIKDGGCSPTRASAPRTHASSLIRTVPLTLLLCQRRPGWHVGFCPLLYYAAPSVCVPC